VCPAAVGSKVPAQFQDDAPETMNPAPDGLQASRRRQFIEPVDPSEETANVAAGGATGVARDPFDQAVSVRGQRLQPPAECGVIRVEQRLRASSTLTARIVPDRIPPRSDHPPGLTQCQSVCLDSWRPDP
jgi:hypothetical protein